MNITVNNGRSAYWDNIKGLLIFLTVFAHILFQLQEKSGVINTTVDYIYMFHMPAFVFVSGFFGKSERARSFENIIKLIFLYFIFNSLMGFVYGFNSLLKPMYSYWYLIALIAWRLTAHYIAKFKDINLILFVIALIAGYYSSIDNSFAVARIIGFYPYYMAGFLLSNESSQKVIEIKYSKRLCIGLGLAVITAVAAFASQGFFNFSDGDYQMENYASPMAAVGRIALFAIAFLAIYTLRYISPNKSIPLLTKWGKNSLWIFILHRPVTLIVSDLIGGMKPAIIMVISLAVAIIICIIFGNEFVVKYLNQFLKSGASIFTSDGNKKINFSKIAFIGVALWYIFSVVINEYVGVFGTFNGVQNDELNNDADIIYSTISDQQKSAFDSAFRITFAGDLILLEDQVKRAYNGTEYDFAEVFEYAKPYIETADLAMGVFEGPMAGENAGYSTGNFDDNKALYLNFPDAFAEAVKDAGFDLVTTANNHLLDKGEAGALRTIDVLDKIGLDHTGSYKNYDDKKKNHIKIVESQGIKLAILSYTYGSNNISTDELIAGEYGYLTSVISGTQGERFDKLKQMVEQDFVEAKAMNPDLIVVLPHIGTQFSNEADEEQKVWFEIFKNNGADIILGDHPHVVEPITIEEYKGKNIFTAYCPGNFANLYRKDQGDTSMLIDVYVDRDSKKVVGGSIVPLYTYAMAEGNYRAVPIYEIMNNFALRAQLTTDDLELASKANGLISKIVFGHEMDITSATQRYYFDENGFLRSKANGLELTEELKSGMLYSEIEIADSICFVGDSVTEGTKNGGCPWYEPIEEFMAEKKIYNFSKGGCTVSYIIDNADKIPASDLYVVAIGTNDVRYRDESTCAMTAQDYVAKISQLKDILLQKSAKNIIFIAPWYSTDGDPFCNLPFERKTMLNDEYSLALENYCKDNGVGFINANNYLKNTFSTSVERKYLLDHIHPNASAGVVLYSKAVLAAR